MLRLQLSGKEVELVVERGADPLPLARQVCREHGCGHTAFWQILDGISRHATGQGITYDRDSLFEIIYEERLWGDVSSGEGSNHANTRGTLATLEHVVRQYGITSLLDAPCGDLTWMPELWERVPELEYFGVDIVPGVIANVSRAFPGQRFAVADIVDDPLPKSDLILCRDTLRHMTVDAVFQTLDNFSRSGSKYLLATTYPGYANVDLVDGWPTKYSMGYATQVGTSYNLMEPPFGLPEPIAVFDELHVGKALGLWRLPLPPFGSGPPWEAP